MVLIFVFISFISIIFPYLIFCSNEKPKADSPKVLKKENIQVKQGLDIFNKIENNGQKDIINESKIEEDKKESHDTAPKCFDVPAFIPSDNYRTQLKENDYEMIVIKS
uniref:Uncharacterized protein n=1 Tax=Strongyloides stercoralis TaxID=6248 RepID=A0A0K0DV64_STRER